MISLRVQACDGIQPAFMIPADFCEDDEYCFGGMMPINVVCPESAATITENPRNLQDLAGTSPVSKNVRSSLDMAIGMEDHGPSAYDNGAALPLWHSLVYCYHDDISATVAVPHYHSEVTRFTPFEKTSLVVLESVIDTYSERCLCFNLSSTTG